MGVSVEKRLILRERELEVAIDIAAGAEPQIQDLLVRFIGDRVTMVEIAALGKPIEIHDKDEMGGFNPPENTREIALGDKQPGGNENTPPPPPSLRLPGEPVPTGGEGKVQFPTAAQPIPPPPTAPPNNSPSPPHIL